MSFNFLLLLKCTTMVSEIFDMAKLQATICCQELKKISNQNGSDFRQHNPLG